MTTNVDENEDIERIRDALAGNDPDLRDINTKLNTAAGKTRKNLKKKLARRLKTLRNELEAAIKRSQRTAWLGTLPLDTRVHIMTFMAPREQARCEVAGKALAAAQFLSDGKTPVAAAMVQEKFGGAFFPEGLRLKTPAAARCVYGKLLDFASHKACADREPDEQPKVKKRSGYFGSSNIRYSADMPWAGWAPLRNLQGHRLQDGIRFPRAHYQHRGPPKIRMGGYEYSESEQNYPHKGAHNFDKREICLLCEEGEFLVALNVVRNNELSQKTVTGKVSCAVCGFSADIASHCDGCSRVWIKLPPNFFEPVCGNGVPCEYSVVNGTPLDDKRGLPASSHVRHGGGTNGGGMRMCSNEELLVPMKCCWKGPDGHGTCSGLNALTVCLDCNSVAGDASFFDCYHENGFIEGYVKPDCGPPHYIADNGLHMWGVTLPGVPEEGVLPVRYCHSYYGKDPDAPGGPHEPCRDIFCSKHPMHAFDCYNWISFHCEDCICGEHTIPNPNAAAWRGQIYNLPARRAHVGATCGEGSGDFDHGE